MTKRVLAKDLEIIKPMPENLSNTLRDLHIIKRYSLILPDNRDLGTIKSLNRLTKISFGENIASKNLLKIREDDDKDKIMIVAIIIVDMDMLRRMLADGADPNATSGELATIALAAAAESGNVEAGRILLEAGADPSIWTGAGETAYDMAIRRGHRKFAELLSQEQSEIALSCGGRVLKRLKRSMPKPAASGV